MTTTVKWVAVTTTTEYLEWLRTHYFQRYCMVCRRLSRHCRMFNHFGGARYDWNKERIVWASETT